MLIMRGGAAILFLLLGLCVAPPQTPAQIVQSTAISPRITVLLAQNPTGGPALRAAIAAAVEADPSLTNDVVAAAATANTAQQEAIGAGLADAASFFMRIDSSATKTAAALIQKIAATADPTTRFWFSRNLSRDLAEELPGLGGTGVSASGCTPISPSRPGQSC